VLVGRAYDGVGEVRRRAEGLSVQNSLVELPAVDDRTLRALYGGCTALLFPSLYEGFGLPVLEAMACGAPVVASNRASVPEVVGDAGLLTDPDDYAGMAAGVQQLIENPALRGELIQRGHTRVAGFSWEAAAQRTVDLLCEVAVPQRAQV
jgi:glycosyltransferase involved in cell wall biosynthesis